jgi:uncharacterized protein (TIGR02453 family)
MDRFEGFADASGGFFKRLAKKNEREWFTAHKAEFEEGWNAPMKALLAEVKAGIDAAYEHCDLGEPKVFRIYRDVRFSKNKAPYKTHIGGFIPIAVSGRSATDTPIALYFHLGADEKFGAAGYYRMEPEPLARFRAAVAEEKRGKEVEKLLASLAKKGFAEDTHERMKRVPKGFDAEHPRAEMLKRKGLIADFPALPAGILTTPKLVPWLVRACKTTAPLVEWLVFATS